MAPGQRNGDTVLGTHMAPQPVLEARAGASPARAIRNGSASPAGVKLILVRRAAETAVSSDGDRWIAARRRRRWRGPM